MRKAIALLVLLTFAFATQASANNGKSPEIPKGNVGVVASQAGQAAENAKAAEKKAEAAASEAEAAASEASQKQKLAAEAEAERVEAVKGLERALAAADDAAKQAGQSEAAKSKASEAKAAAEAAASEAEAKAQEARKKAIEALEARGSAVAKTKVSEALSKVKGADDACLEYIADASSEQANECEEAKYVVRFAAGVDNGWQARGLEAIKVKIEKRLTGSANGVVASLSPKQLAQVAKSSRTESIERDFEIRLEQTQSDATWGLDRVDQANLPLDSTYTNPSIGVGVSVYVVDTGILGSHTEFEGRVSSGFTAISDGNNTVDCNGHGTHVAGIIGSKSFGVAKGAELIPVRVMDCNGAGSLSTVAAGLDWISREVSPGSRAVVNMSIGGGISPTLDSLVENLVGRGITVVVAAGNAAQDACDYSPARATRALTVAASTKDDVFASFSNFGSCVDLIAPGYQITSTWISSNTSAAILSGTSMAAPHVSGLAATLLTNKYLSPADVEFRLESGASPGLVTGIPGGTPNLLARVVAAPPSTTVPEAPAQPEELPEDFATVPVAPELAKVNYWRNSVRVFWKIAPDGGSPLVSHMLKVWSNGELIQQITVGPEADNAKVRSLDWGGRYTFTVVATNAIGTSGDSQTTEIYSPDRTMKGLQVWRAS